MAEAIFDKLNERIVLGSIRAGPQLVELAADRFDDIEVVSLGIAAEAVGLAGFALFETASAGCLAQWSSTWIQSRTLPPSP